MAAHGWRAGGSLTCLLSVLAWWVCEAQPVESVRLSAPDLLKHFVVNCESLVQNEAQLITGRARPAVNPSPLQGG